MTQRAMVDSEAWRGMVFYDQSVGAGATGPRTAVRAQVANQSANLVALRQA